MKPAASGKVKPVPSDDPGLRLWTESDDTAHVVHVEGELDLHTRTELETVLQSLPRPPLIVVLEASGLRFVDSTGLRTIMDEHRRARAGRYEFVVAGANHTVREVLRITALDVTLPLAPDVASVTGA
jgi:anti-sigma B factor antagonist